MKRHDASLRPVYFIVLEIITVPNFCVWINLLPLLGNKPVLMHENELCWLMWTIKLRTLHMYNRISVDCTRFLVFQICEICVPKIIGIHKKDQLQWVQQAFFQKHDKVFKTNLSAPYIYYNTILIPTMGWDLCINHSCRT